MGEQQQGANSQSHQGRRARARCLTRLTHLPPRPPPRGSINGPRSPLVPICRDPPLPHSLSAAYPAPRTIRPCRFRSGSASHRVPMRVPPGSAPLAPRSALPPAERAGTAAGYRLRAASGGGCRLFSGEGAAEASGASRFRPRPRGRALSSLWARVCPSTAEVKAAVPTRRAGPAVTRVAALCEPARWDCPALPGGCRRLAPV